MNSIKKSAALILLFSAAISVPFHAWSQQKTGFKVLKDHKIGSSGGWDYITVDPASNRMYVSHGNQVNILSLSGDSVGYIPNTTGVHGIALVAPLGKGYTSNGRANTCTVFDLKTNKMLSQIAVGQNPDAIFYDAYSKKVFAFNGRSKDATVIDPATDQLVATIPLGGKPETGVSDGKGKIFVNNETTNEIIVINANTLKVENKFKIEGGEAPSGLDIDRETNRLFIGCSDNKTVVVMDAANGKVLAKFAGGDCDGLVFDPATKMSFSSNNEGFITVVKELSADKFEFVENITTEPNARTIAIDLTTRHLFLPAAKTEPAVGSARPRQIPGSFHVIEVGK